jgi:hypothetical protein
VKPSSRSPQATRIYDNDLVCESFARPESGFALTFRGSCRGIRSSRNDLEISDAIRLFLLQVVRRGGLPFAMRDPTVRVVSGKHLWAMKRKAQVRDHELAARGEVPPAAMLLLRPERLQGALVEWPDASPIDD